MSPYELPPEWTFTCSIAQPDGITAECTIRLPLKAEYADVLEVSEMVQMGASHALAVLRRTRSHFARRAAF